MQAVNIFYPDPMPLSTYQILESLAAVMLVVGSILYMVLT
jgi:hypothetical protein